MRVLRMPAPAARRTGLRPLIAALAALAVSVGMAAVPSGAQAADPGVPGAPQAVSARAGVNSAKVYWSAPAADGGSPVTRFVATASPGGGTCTGGPSTTSCTVSGLSNGQPYTFTVAAENANGSSEPSAPSNAVTPANDVTDPVLRSATVSPARASSLGGTVTVELRITDDLSGIRTPSGGFDANPAVLFEQRGGESTFGFTRAVTRVSGDEYDGIYRATVNVPSGTPAGWWDLLVYPIDDNAGNSTFFQNPPGASVLVGAPSEPRNVVATPTADRSVTVTWDAPADNGGNAVTSYTLTDSLGGSRQVTPSATGGSWTGTFRDIPASQDITFTVTATNAAGVSPTSSPSTPVRVPAVAPDAPRNATAVRGDGRLDVQWTAPDYTGGAPISGYTVTVSPGSHTVSAGPDARSVSVTGLTNGTAYRAEVRAENSAGSSLPATTAEATPAGVPSTVGDVTAVRGDRSATVSWSAAEPNGAQITGYTVTASPGEEAVTVGPSATTATVSGLSNGTSYTFVVTAANEVGTSATSQPSNAVVPAGVPATVTNLVAARGDRSALITWSAAAGNGSPVSGYTVTVTPDGGQSSTRNLAADVTSLALNDLTNGTSYAIEVVAHNEIGQSVAAHATVRPAGIPAQVTGVTAVPGDRSATVSWTAPDGNGAPITGYTVTASPGGATVRVAGGVTSATITGLSNETTYTFTVTATNVAGASAASEPSNGVTLAGAPLPAREVKAAPGNGTVTITWAPADGNGAPVTGYVVTASPGGRTVSVGAGATQAVFPELTNGVQYTFSVVATNAVGSSTAATVSATPATVPAQPSKPKAKVKGSKVTITWSPVAANGSPVTAYRVGGGKVKVKTVNGTATKVVFPKVKRGVHRITVTAVNGVGESLASTPVKVRVR